MSNQDLLTLREAADFSGRGKKTLQSLVERGTLPAVRQDGQWLVARSDLALLYQLELQAAAAITLPDSDPLPQQREHKHSGKGSAPDAADVPSIASLEPFAAAQEPHTQPPQRSEVALLLKMLRQRDEQIATLQEDRARLSGPDRLFCKGC